MKEIKALDVNGDEIQRGDMVEVIGEKEGLEHPWLRIGKKLKVSYWEDRGTMKYPYICVFLKSKSGRLCQQGMQDKKLKIVKGGN